MSNTLRYGFRDNRQAIAFWRLYRRLMNRIDVEHRPDPYNYWLGILATRGLKRRKLLNRGN